MKKAREPVGEARDDFLDLRRACPAPRPGRRLYRRPRHHGVAKASLRAVAREVGRAGVTIPAFDDFWQAGIAEQRAKAGIR